MSPLARKLIDAAIAIGLTLGVVLLIVVTSSFLTARGSYAHGFKLWLGLVQRPDIVGTVVLTVLVTIGYTIWQQGKRSR
jgi:hypothetical protein